MSDILRIILPLTAAAGLLLSLVGCETAPDTVPVRAPYIPPISTAAGGQ